jgi:hypothetical protein
MERLPVIRDPCSRLGSQAEALFATAAALKPSKSPTRSRGLSLPLLTGSESNRFWLFWGGRKLALEQLQLDLGVLLVDMVGGSTASQAKPFFKPWIPAKLRMFHCELWTFRKCSRNMLSSLRYCSSAVPISIPVLKITSLQAEQRPLMGILPISRRMTRCGCFTGSTGQTSPIALHLSVAGITLESDLTKFKTAHYRDLREVDAVAA